MMRRFLIPLTAMTMAAVPAAADDFDDGRYDRFYASRGEAARSYGRVQAEREDLWEARRFGDRDDVRDARRDLERAEREYRRDVRDLNRGRGGWSRYDTRVDRYNAGFDGRPLGANDRIWRGQDNRYYCRRSDGTTGLLVGAIGGGVLGNVVAPGGSKTLGSIIGGSLGAVVGKSIDRNNVTCR
jgi:hypothetical protein